jgi:hypothetical protein
MILKVIVMRPLVGRKTMCSIARCATFKDGNEDGEAYDFVMNSYYRPLVSEKSKRSEQTAFVNKNIDIRTNSDKI